MIKKRSPVARLSAGWSGRLGGLAIVLSTGMWLAAAAGTAAADTDTGAADTAVLSSVPLPAGVHADPLGLDIAVSYDGIDLLQMGDAVADSGAGDLSLAVGHSATAQAGSGVPASDYPFLAVALGTDSTAIAHASTVESIYTSIYTAGSGLDSAVALDGATADAGFQTIAAPYDNTYSFGDVAIASGAGSSADSAGFSDYAIAAGGGMADSGFSSTGGPFLPSPLGEGPGDLAIAEGTGSTAAANYSRWDTAVALGHDSHALVGGLPPGDFAHPGDVAAVVGNMLTANATEGAGHIDVEVSNLTTVAADAAAASSHELGLGGLLADLSWLPGALGL
jgi:hypothetical protein